MVRKSTKIGIIAGAVLVALLIVTILLSFTVTWEAVTSNNVSNRLSPPSQQHLFGTDNLGRDMLSRVIYGIRISLSMGVIATLIALAAGAILGAAKECLGKLVGTAVVCISRFLSAGPAILLIVIIPTTFGQAPPFTAAGIAAASGIALVLIPGFIRVFGGVVLCIKNRDAKSTAGVIIARISRSIALAVLIYSALGFLGFGVPAPIPELGGLISASRDSLRNAPWLVVYPGLALTFIVLSLNILGESLNSAVLAVESGRLKAMSDAVPLDGYPAYDTADYPQPSLAGHPPYAPAVYPQYSPAEHPPNDPAAYPQPSPTGQASHDPTDYAQSSPASTGDPHNAAQGDSRSPPAVQAPAYAAQASMPEAPVYTQASIPIAPVSIQEQMPVAPPAASDPAPEIMPFAPTQEHAAEKLPPAAQHVRGENNTTNENSGKKSSAKDTIGTIIIAIGVIGFLVMTVKTGIIGFYPHELIWIAPAYIISVILVGAGAKQNKG